MWLLHNFDNMIRGYIAIIFLYSVLWCNAGASNTTPVDTAKMAVALKEVEVRPDRLIMGHDKIMLPVNKNLQKHSYDGYSLLNVAMIPGLDVDPFNRTVKSQNYDVLLCINGIRATQDEIRTINPRDVTRIDFYTGYDPRNPTSRFTLDFIVKIRDYGGQVVLQASQHMNRLTGSDMADWRMFHGKTEFGVRLEENYDTYAQGKKEDENISLTFDNGDMTISRNSKIEYNCAQSLQVKPYLVYRKKNETLKLTFAIQQQHLRQRRTDNERYLCLYDETRSNARISDHNDRFIPALSGMYQHKFNNSSYLSVFFSGNYSRTNQSNNYLSLEDVLSRTHEDFYSGSATVQYSFGFLRNHNGIIGVGGKISRSEIDYKENESSSDPWLTTRSMQFIIADNWRISRSLSLNFMLGGNVNNTDNTYRRTSEFTFIPSLGLNWTITQRNSLNFNFNIRSQRPPMSYYFPEEKWIMPYIRQIGNPYLKSSTVTSTSLSYRNMRKWGYLEAFCSYTGVSRSVYFDFLCDNSREVYIQTFRNGRTFHDFSIGPRIQFKVIPQKLTMRIGGVWNYTRAFTYTSLKRHTFRGDVNLMYISGGVTANIMCSTPAKYMDALGIVGYVPWTLQMSLNYTISNFNIGVSARNPFMTTPTRSTAVLPGITTLCKSYSQRSNYNMFSISIGYRFSYGKPKKQYEDVQLKVNENTAILKR